jgi:hypothetical protein
MHHVVLWAPSVRAASTLTKTMWAPLVSDLSHPPCERRLPRLHVVRDSARSFSPPALGGARAPGVQASVKIVDGNGPKPVHSACKRRKPGVPCLALVGGYAGPGVVTDVVPCDKG